jgi:integrase
MSHKLRDKRLYWRGSTIWARVLGPAGRIIRQTTKCRDEAAAVAKANEFERVASDPSYAAAQATTLEAAVTAYVADKKRRGAADATLKIAAVKAGHFIRIWGPDLPMLRVTSKLVADYIDKRLGEGVKRHTVYLELGHLRQTLKIATHLGTFHTPIERVLPPYFTSGHRPKDRWPTPEELTKLVSHLSKHRAAHVLYFAATGARLGEAARARRGDTDFARRLVHLRGTKTEKADDDVPITVVNEAMLRWSLDHAPGKGLLFKPWGKLHRDLAAACVRAGIRKVTPNDLRRAFAKYHRLAGVDVTTVSKMLRHTTDKLAQTTYAKVSGNEVGDLASKQILSPFALSLPGVSILYAGAAETAGNEGQRDVFDGANMLNSAAPPARVELATNALGRRHQSARSVGNKAAWGRKRADSRVSILYPALGETTPETSTPKSRRLALAAIHAAALAWHAADAVVSS